MVISPFAVVEYGGGLSVGMAIPFLIKPVSCTGVECSSAAREKAEVEAWGSLFLQHILKGVMLIQLSNEDI